MIVPGPEYSQGIAHTQGDSTSILESITVAQGRRIDSIIQKRGEEWGHPPPDIGWGVTIEDRMGVELLGARYSRWLNRTGKSWSVREDGVALKGRLRWRGRKHCLIQGLMSAVKLTEVG